MAIYAVFHDVRKANTEDLCLPIFNYIPGQFFSMNVGTLLYRYSWRNYINLAVNVIHLSCTVDVKCATWLVFIGWTWIFPPSFPLLLTFLSILLMFSKFVQLPDDKHSNGDLFLNNQIYVSTCNGKRFSASYCRKWSKKFGFFRALPSDLLTSWQANKFLINLLRTQQFNSRFPDHQDE